MSRSPVLLLATVWVSISGVGLGSVSLGFDAQDSARSSVSLAGPDNFALPFLTEYTSHHTYDVYVL